MLKKNWKKIFVFEINASELVALNCIANLPCCFMMDPLRREF